MAIKQNKTKTAWQVNIQPGGRSGKRIKKTFPTKAEALAWERHIQAKVQETPEWSPQKKDARTLSDLVDIWQRHHGSGLRAGADTYRRLLAMCTAMGNPRSDLFTADQFAEYRAKRINDGVTANNMNREQSYLRAVFNELIRLDHWKKENPLQKLRAFKIQEKELSYLAPEQITILLAELSQAQNPHVALVTKVCLSTGARWGEAESLRISQARSGVIQFVQTKSSKARAVPITPQLEEELKKHHDKYGNDERLFTTAYSAFRDALKRTELKLPAGQMTHILRHTFASHFIMNGGNILALQKVLGHHSLAMTMRYARLSPEHLQETRKLNPISALNLG
ncbi:MULTISPECIES: tyrosine-type recombinase/integrase [unclassified Undibacterium]|uniref:phage integrase n=1 Tax=unclassified Undibacterium TaxID=2630295 RepID=UPI002AC9574B|nr:MULTISPECIES: tyrosine-type recombinase/integrase [unclassified Undibacterium]MEB0137640.1 tyrosine-type recombinase/integrase [Undibacterium sp. CCC2.1]MEB0170641.1 tyrosine-type recombinase/integrase [Undibacterium sp. CCC1.1]MEB0174582.1 tyrosine-type recombinase/integrase [Undibacterium sp. CCC3.4]MEB0213621.1 tyrosine-type recombinase/integrase [Undibacterium sp. 5I2]WPX43790.1 tyrosine-type recombinase/integrase [Undibacterium sp. CCC3.4]